MLQLAQGAGICTGDMELLRYDDLLSVFPFIALRGSGPGFLSLACDTCHYVGSAQQPEQIPDGECLKEGLGHADELHSQEVSPGSV